RQLGASPPFSTGFRPDQCKVARNFSIFGKFSRNVRVLKIATSRNFVRKFVGWCRQVRKVLETSIEPLRPARGPTRGLRHRIERDGQDLITRSDDDYSRGDQGDSSTLSTSSTF